MRSKKWPGRLLLIAGLALLAFYLGARLPLLGFLGLLLVGASAGLRSIRT